MRSEQFEHIQTIRNEFYQASERARDSLNNAIQHLASGLYSRNPHFIFELIQNAEDNTYDNSSPSLSFWLTKIDPTGTEGSDGALIIENNETGFTSENVDAICRVGKTTKKKAQGYIGEKGIGFKSVFLVTDSPHIFSNGFHFCLPEHDDRTGFGYIVPQWVEAPPRRLDLTKTHIILPLAKPSFGYNQIEGMLLEIEPETILFLSKLQKIRIKTDSGTEFSILKNDAAMPEVELLVEGDKQHRSFSKGDRFLVCTETVYRPADIHHEKREGIENREISIAFPLDEDSAGAGKIFAYLPVRSDTEFPFLINADFILPSSREDIQDAPWNHWLMGCVANLVASMLLPALKERELLTANFLEKIASRLNNFGEAISGTSYVVDRNSLFRPIFDRVRETLMYKEFLPANDGTFVSASNAKLARGEAIRELLQDGQLASLFGSNHEIKWLSDKITQDLTPHLRRFLMGLDIDEVRPPMFASRLSRQFLEQQDDTWIIKFYKFLSTHYRDLRHYLPSKPILRLQDGNHVNLPLAGGSPPSAYLPIGVNTDSSFPVIKAQLTEDDEVRRFLKELGVPEWDIVEEVIEHVLPKYECDFPTVPIEDHRSDFEIIERAYNTTDSQTKKTRLQNKLVETPFILAENTLLGEPRYCKPEQLYFATDELRIYFEGNSSRAFVNLEEYQDSARELLKGLGVVDIVRVNKKEPNYEGYVVISNWPYNHKRGLDGFDPNIQIDELNHALIDPNAQKSEFIWNYVAKSNSNCIRGIVESSTNQDYRRSSTEEVISDEFGRLLIEIAWLPDFAGNMHRPCELTLDELPESFERDANLAEQLGMKKDEEAELAEKVGIPVEWIEVLKEAPPEVLNRPGILEKIKELVGGEDLVKGNVINSILSDPKFPESPVKDPDYRAAMIDEEFENSPMTESELLERSVRNSAPREAARARLKSEYTNEEEQMICQICHREMPFKKRDGEYYFEAVEALNKEHFMKEHEAQFLALCPECAARYQEFIKTDKDAMQEMINQLMASEECQIPLPLGELNPYLRFVEKHWRDIKQILKKSSRDTFRQ